MSVQHPIQVAARLAGLSPHVIRVWEKRYGAVTPARTGTNRRLYSDDEVERLRLLAMATAAGHQIGIIARLERGDLERLVATVVPPAPVEVGRTAGHPVDGAVSPAASELVSKGGNGVGVGNTGRSPGVNEADGPVANGGAALVGMNSRTRVWPLPVGGGDGGDVAEGLVRDALEATRAFSPTGLVEVLERGAVRFGPNGVLHRVVCPLAQLMGDLWQRGELTAAHEHFASALIRDTLARSLRPYGTAEGAPRLIVATPAGQLHELGAVIVAAAAANLGWRPVYLGASLPSSDIAGAALQNQARAVLLSIVYPSDDRQLGSELRQLRRFLPPSVAVVVGGRAARAYDPVLREIGAVVPADLHELGGLLAALRGGPEGGRDDAPVPGL